MNKCPLLIVFGPSRRHGNNTAVRGEPLQKHNGGFVPSLPRHDAFSPGGPLYTRESESEEDIERENEREQEQDSERERERTREKKRQREREQKRVRESENESERDVEKKDSLRGGRDREHS